MGGQDNASTLIPAILGLGGNVTGIAVNRPGLGQPLTQFSQQMQERQLEQQRLQQQAAQEAERRTESKQRIALDKARTEAYISSIQSKDLSKQEKQQQLQNFRGDLLKQVQQDPNLPENLKNVLTTSILRGETPEKVAGQISSYYFQQQAEQSRRDNKPQKANLFSTAQEALGMFETPEEQLSAVKANTRQFFPGKSGQDEQEKWIEEQQNLGYLPKPGGWFKSPKPATKQYPSSALKQSPGVQPQPTITTPAATSTTTTTMPSGLTPEQEARRQELLRRKGQ